MCGRFTLATPPEILAALFGIDEADWNDPRFNIAPQTRVVAVSEGNAGRSARSLLWGAANPRDKRPLINARSETAAASPFFARAFSSARVLVPADGFFEWTKEGTGRQARYFRQGGGLPFAFAGLAVGSEGSSGPEAPSAVILTAKASKSVRKFHGRMPLLVNPMNFERWLDPGADLRTVQRIIEEGASAVWASYAVSDAVNQVRNDSPDNIRPEEPAPARQGSLF